MKFALAATFFIGLMSAATGWTASVTNASMTGSCVRAKTECTITAGGQINTDDLIRSDGIGYVPEYRGLINGAVAVEWREGPNQIRDVCDGCQPTPLTKGYSISGEGKCGQNNTVQINARGDGDASFKAAARMIVHCPAVPTP
jgi:hypothetical protein